MNIKEVILKEIIENAKDEYLQISVIELIDIIRDKFDLELNKFHKLSLYFEDELEKFENVYENTNSDKKNVFIKAVSIAFKVSEEYLRSYISGSSHVEESIIKHQDEKVIDFIYSTSFESLAMNSPLVLAEKVSISVYEIIDEIRKEIMKKISEDQENQPDNNAKIEIKVKDEDVVNILKEFGFEYLNEILRDIDVEVLGREKEIEELKTILLKEWKKNAVLLGEPGVGKTALIEHLAKENVIHVMVTEPNKLMKLHENNKLKEIFELKAKNVVIFIDEFHMLLEGVYEDVRNELKKYITRSQIKLVVATTHDEFKAIYKQDRAFQRRFVPVFVIETDEKTTKEIIRRTIEKLVNIKNILVDENEELKIINMIYEASTKIQNKYNPDKSIDITDLIFAEAKKLNVKSIKSSLVKEIIERVLRVKLSIEMSKDEIYSKLKSRVYHQDHVLEKISEVLESNLFIKIPGKPLLTSLFTGPTGVGKTETAKAIAEVIFGDEDKIIRIDMSEYQESHSIARFIGSPPGYVGYTEGGQLTEAVKRNPQTVILLDEIEKAHETVRKILLQVLDEGRLTDGMGETVSFEHCIFIATTNLIRNYIESEKVLRERLVRAGFAPEFVNRFDIIVSFKELPVSVTVKILEKEIRKLVEQLKISRPELDVNVSVSDEVRELFENDATGNKTLNGRDVVRLFLTRVKPRLIKHIRNEYKSGKRSIYIEVTPDYLKQ